MSSKKVYQAQQPMSSYLDLNADGTLKQKPGSASSISAPKGSSTPPSIKRRKSSSQLNTEGSSSGKDFGDSVKYARVVRRNSFDPSRINRKSRRGSGTGKRGIHWKNPVVSEVRYISDFGSVGLDRRNSSADIGGELLSAQRTPNENRAIRRLQKRQMQESKQYTIFYTFLRIFTCFSAEHKM